jgi:hypothetical protein
MAGEGSLAESLSRLEHKVDLILEFFATFAGPGKNGTFILTPVGDTNHVCPVCTQNVSYQIDIMNKVVARVCGCSTGMQAPIDMAALAPPVPTPKPVESSNGNDPSQEDRFNPRSRGGDRRR